VTNIGATAQTSDNPAVSDPADDTVQGWYFYGITRRGPPAAQLSAAVGEHQLGTDPIAAPSGAGLQLLEFSGLAAVVSPTRLAHFSHAALQERMQNASALEAMVRSHNRVIEAIHARQAILPAKFGVVYAQAEDVLSALRPAHDTLLQQLRRLEGCDEWAVHLYADHALVRERISMEDRAIRRLRAERDAARPGRAYFLEQQIRDELEAATAEVLSTIAQRTFERLAAHAVIAEVNTVVSDADLVGEVEILRASLLVARDDEEHFKEEVRSSTAASEGLRCEYSGPWPPYSFAVQDHEVAG
jgi:hypothetical protein